MKHTFFYFFFSFMLLTSCVANGQNTKEVSAEEFQKELSASKDAQLLDVRTAGEFETGYIKNAMWADWLTQEEFQRRTDALDKNKPTYVYCLSGGRSSKAVRNLAERGFTNVIELQGGINAWKQADLPVVIEKKAAQISEKTYQGMLSSKEVVLVDFGAVWCAPCRKMEPVIQEIETENTSKLAVVKIDAGSQDELVKRYKIEQLPTFIIYKNGKEVTRFSGLTDKATLEEVLKKLF